MREGCFEKLVFHFKSPFKKAGYFCENTFKRRNVTKQPRSYYCHKRLSCEQLNRINCERRESIMKNILLCAFLAVYIYITPCTVAAQDYWKHYDGFKRGGLSLFGSAARDSMNCIIGGYFYKWSTHIFKTSDGGKSWKIIYSDSVRTDKSKTPAYVSMNLMILDMAYLSNGVMLVVADSNITVQEKNGNTTTTYDKLSGVILRSADEGKTWTSFSLGSLSDSIVRKIDRISMSDSLNGIINIRSGGEVKSDYLYTTDGGITWKEGSVPDNKRFYAYSVASPRAGLWYLCSRNRDTIMWKSEDYGATWKKIAAPDAFIEKIEFVSPLIGYAAGFKGSSLLSDFIAKTTDGGEIWVTILDTVQKPTRGLLDISFADETNGVAVGRGGKILRTVNGGITWQQEESGLEDYVAEHILGVVSSTPHHTIATGLDGKILMYVPEGILEQPEWLTPPRSGVYQEPLDIPFRPEWLSVTGAEKYQLQIGLTNYYGEDPPPLKRYPIVLDTIITTNTPQITNLQSGIEYHIRVRAIAGSDTSNWSKPTGFWTKAVVSVQDAVLPATQPMPYPNPAHDRVTIPFKTSGSENISITLTDITGRAVHGFESYYAEAQQAIVLTRIQDIPGGMYFVQVQSGKSSSSIPVVIAR
jgi:photosystem II stability/assembly factor-like uncharacterized protein